MFVSIDSNTAATIVFVCGMITLCIFVLIVFKYGKYSRLDFDDHKSLDRDIFQYTCKYDDNNFQKVTTSCGHTFFCEDISVYNYCPICGKKLDSDDG